MPRYGGRELPRQGMKGGSTGLPDDKAMRQWMPEVLFQPQISGPVNKANCKPIEPTPCYDADDMPVFRPMGGNDIAQPAKNVPKNNRTYHPVDWKTY